MKPLIAICSQDADFYLLLSHILEVDGFTPMLAASIDDVLALVCAKPIAAVLLDCRADNHLAAQSSRLKQDTAVGALPCVALVHAGAEAQLIQLLQSGIDECFVRPFAPAKLLQDLRSRLAIGLTPEPATQDGRPLAYADVEMRLDTHRVSCAGKEIALGPIEFKLLRHMLENPERVLSRAELIGAAWARNRGVGARTVDVHISQLRKQLSQCSGDAAIRTVRLAGYALARSPS
ncbi:response regulator transcription factor [Mesorhizobium sp. B2-3-14]|uniref:winged helix-turn-helix transcriptional regulator n=1 Tax=Mesorhizobium sp. B2-3-14 TaxID=2589950 RepID=UPI0011267442|nr:response regulator transcription factor [Mesorhizobium sp. B2-3-14]TPL79882.1 response regulator transcription factor [Mesorhizobium sp. B2-3-14]